MIDASIIVCVRNGEATIAAQLAALAAQECSHPWELVVVDNGSTDATAGIVRDWSDRLPMLRLIGADERTGLAYARNVGTAAASGGILAFCDADDVADRGWLAALVTGAQEADIVGGELELTQLNTERARHWRTMLAGDMSRPHALGYLPYAPGANFAIRRRAFDAVGGCDEAFTICSDDIDLSWRVQRHGGTLAFCDEAIMHYRLRDDLPGLVRQMHAYGLAEALLRRKFGDAVPPSQWAQRWPTYRFLMTHSWHLLADSRRRGGWLAHASYSAGRIHGAIRHRVAHY